MSEWIRWIGILLVTISVALAGWGTAHEIRLTAVETTIKDFKESQTSQYQYLIKSMDELKFDIKDLRNDIKNIKNKAD